MTSNREGANIWWILRHPKYSHWRFKKAFQSPYFWQDSFLKFWHRLIGCHLSGHRIVPLSDDGSHYYNYCFKCYRKIGATMRIGYK